jgi:hypothetical protein
MVFREYDSIEDAFADMQRAEDAANEGLSEWNKQVTWGSHYMRPCPEIPCIVFGYIYTERESEEAEKRCGADPEELAYTMRSMRAQHERGYRFGRHYSIVEPDGELGSVHIANAWPISKEEFEEAQRQDWVLSEDQLLRYWNRFGNKERASE